jgi:Flavin containing amine oxidoreductase
MGLLNKYVMEFANSPDNGNTDLFPTTAQFFFQRVGASYSDDVLCEYANLQYVHKLGGVTPARKTLYGFAAGSLALNLTALTDAAVKALELSQLNNMMGPTLGQPTNFMRTVWENDPWTYGSYSFYKVGSSQQDRKSFSSSGSKCMAFAGEHTSVAEAATVHGAYRSGIDAITSLSITPTAQPSPTTSVSPTPSASGTTKAAASKTASVTPSGSPTRTRSRSATPTATRSRTPSATRSHT